MTPVLAGDLLGHDLTTSGSSAARSWRVIDSLRNCEPRYLKEYVLVDQFHVDEDLPQALAGLALALEGLVQLICGQDLSLPASDPEAPGQRSWG